MRWLIVRPCQAWMQISSRFVPLSVGLISPTVRTWEAFKGSTREVSYVGQVCLRPLLPSILRDGFIGFMDAIGLMKTSFVGLQEPRRTESNKEKKSVRNSNTVNDCYKTGSFPPRYQNILLTPFFIRVFTCYCTPTTTRIAHFRGQPQLSHETFMKST